MLVACRLAGLSALETYYAEVRVRAQCGRTQRSRRPSGGRVVQGHPGPVLRPWRGTRMPLGRS
jgi:hypothetical protein